MARGYWFTVRGTRVKSIVREIKNHGGRYNYEAVGFIDDDPGKVGQHIHGVPVLGTRDKLAKILQNYEIDEVLLAIPSASASFVRQILTVLEPFKIPIKTLPGLARIDNGKVGVSHIQDLSVENLLERLPVGMDLRPVEELVKGKTTLITGAGGSIGSELSPASRSI